MMSCQDLWGTNLRCRFLYLCQVRKAVDSSGASANHHFYDTDGRVGRCFGRGSCRTWYCTAPASQQACCRKHCSSHKCCEEAGLTIFYDAGHVQLGLCVNAVATENEPAKMLCNVWADNIIDLKSIYRRSNSRDDSRVRTTYMVQFLANIFSKHLILPHGLGLRMGLALAYRSCLT